MSTTPPSDPWGQGGYPPPGGGSPYPPPPPSSGGGYPPPGGYPGADPSQYPPPPPYGGYDQPGPGWSQGGGQGGYLAGWWYRVGATIIDGFIVGIPVAIIFRVVAGISGFPFEGLDSFFGALYAVVMIGSEQARTFGMMFVGTYVVDATNGLKPGYQKSLIRGIVQFVLAITLIGGLLDIFWPLWDRQNQTLHDKAAGTVLLRRYS